MVSHQVTEYDLFLDESGSFLETSTAPAELSESLKASRQFPSQLAGLLVRRGKLTEGEAKKVLHQALATTQLPPQPVHARALLREQGKEAYNRIVRNLLARLQDRCWQPVRLVNRERVRYGDRIATYTNLVAELILRICEQKRKEGQPRLNLRLFYARVTLGEDDCGTLQFIDQSEYTRRIAEYLAFAAVRHGWARESNGWRLESAHVRSGREDARLQLCDIISHASHDDFRPCEIAAADALRAAFGPYDFTLLRRELVERVEQYLADGALSLALLTLAEALVQGDLADDVRQAAEKRLGEVIERLAGLSSPARDPHLATIVNWLEQVIDVQRSLEVGYRLARWFQAELEQLLRRRLVDSADGRSLDWFDYALHTWALTASNHRGALRAARQEVQKLERLLPSLAGQWEHTTLLMRGLVAQAVHQTDCFDRPAVSAGMQLVTGYYAQLADLFHAALPDLFPTRVHSDLHGQALGTWLQSEIFAGLRDPQRLPEARRLSDRAIEEFAAEANKERQYQCRCQLETAAGEFAEARRYLARSLRLPEISHAALGESIRRLGEENQTDQGFPLLHWFRLGVTAALDGASAEKTSFLVAVAASCLLDNAWCRGELTDYPAHGILRRVAIIQTLRGETGLAIGTLRRLDEILDGDSAERLALQTIRLAAYAEVAAALGKKDVKRARRCLDKDEAGRLGLRQLLRKMEASTRNAFPSVWAVFEPWPAAVSEALSENKVAEGGRGKLLRLARQIGY